MSNHIRAHCPGGTFFFTVRLNDRSSDLLVREKDRLRRATKVTMTRHPFCIDAICILPGAIHTLWTLPPGDGDCARRWSMLKSCFARGLSQPPNSGAPVPRHENGIWQRHYWEHCIRDSADLETHLTLIYTSPVQAGLCPSPEDWPHSSIHRARLSTGHPAGYTTADRSGAAGLHLI